ncbi:MAG: hypothetical protein F4Z25_08890 [Chloroflexi bacterium]|nr:hypothetical protein [Chloroflexota bacterium]MYE47151.1 hypothetical protein [Chloroflexota bacterium]
MTKRDTGAADTPDPEGHLEPGDPDVEPTIGPKPSLRTLRGAFADVLPDATYQDFLDIKSIWEPRMPPDE